MRQWNFKSFARAFIQKFHTRIISRFFTRLFRRTLIRQTSVIAKAESENPLQRKKRKIRSTRKIHRDSPQNSPAFHWDFPATGRAWPAFQRIVTYNVDLRVLSSGLATSTLSGDILPRERGRRRRGETNDRRERERERERIRRIRVVYGRGYYSIFVFGHFIRLAERRAKYVWL